MRKKFASLDRREKYSQETGFEEGREGRIASSFFPLHSIKASFSSPKPTCTIGAPSLSLSGSSSRPINPQDYVNWSEPARDFVWVLKELQEPEKNETSWSQPGSRLVLTGPESVGAACRGCGKSFLLPATPHPSSSPPSHAVITFCSLPFFYLWPWLGNSNLSSLV